MDKSRELRSAAFRGRTEQSQHLVDDEPTRRRFQADRCSIAAVRPLAGVLAQSRRNRVPDDVEDRADQMRVRRDLSAVEPVLKEMADTAMSPIRSARMDSIDLLVTAGNGPFRRTQNDVVVVWHQTPREHLPPILRRRRSELFPQAGAVRSIERDETAVVAARRDVVDAVRIEDAEFPAHENDGRPTTPTRSSRLCNGV